MSESRYGGQPPAELVPDNAPFDEEQRAWLNGFLAGLLGLASNASRGPVDARPLALVGPPRSGGSAPWGDPALTIERRLQLSEGEDLERRLLSALAQLDCGQCGSSCQGYAQALASGIEKDASLCAPGGQSTARHLELLLAEESKSSRGARARALGGAALRAVRGSAEPAAPPEARAVRPSVVAPRSLVRQRQERQQAFHCRVKSQRKLTFADAGSEIREVVLEVPGSEVQYRAGDCLAVFPHNDPDLVRSLLRAVGARGQEIVTAPSGSCEVWRCLLEDVDITHVRDETLRLFAREAVDAEERRALASLVQQGTPNSFDLLDLCSMFPSARPGIDQIVSTLGALDPRLYAIASSPSVHPGELHLAVRMMRAERAGRERKGVASHFLADGVLRGDDLEAHVHPSDRFELPEDRKGPMIMLGSGTGVARFRAFLQELEARGRRGNTWLIMASCFEGDEALYETELKAWSRLGVLEHLDVVKIGQRGRRVGPQDVLRKRARRVISWLDRGAVVYACGEGKVLSALLNDALIEVLGRQGKMSQTQASDFVHVMRRDGRYVEEVY